MSRPRPAIAPAPAAGHDDRPEYRYHLLRAASERFQRNLPSLAPEQREAVERLAGQTFALEELVLASPEADGVMIADTDLQRAFRAVRGRYESEAELDADLARNGLDSAGLRAALRRELLFDTILQRVGARHAAITDTDEQLFFELHRDRFATPERRTARHILVTINADIAENTRAAARARIDAIAAELRQTGTGTGTGAAGDALAERFAGLAARHSECPTAMDGGVLGDVAPGQLYAEVEAALFGLAEGAVSDPVESPLGFHLVLCERVLPGQALAFADARERIRTALEQLRRRDTQRAWIAELRRGAQPRDA